MASRDTSVAVIEASDSSGGVICPECVEWAMVVFEERFWILGVVGWETSSLMTDSARLAAGKNRESSGVEGCEFGGSKEALTSEAGLDSLDEPGDPSQVLVPPIEQ